MASQEPAIQRDASPRAKMSERQMAYACLLVCLIALVFLRGAFLHNNSPTLDEFTHLQAGHRYWECGEFANNPEHPPLVKFLAAMPLRHADLPGYPGACGSRVIQTRSMDFQIAYAVSISPNARDYIREGRSMLVIFPLVLVIAGFFAALAWFGETAAVLTALLLTFEPTLLAHGSLVTTDMAVTTFFFVTICAAIAFARKASWMRGIGATLALGLALASKHSAIVLPAFGLIVLIAAYYTAERRTALWKLAGAWALICLGAFVILWSFYGFRYFALPGRTDVVYDLPGTFASGNVENSLSAHAIEFFARHHVLPEAYLAGFADINVGAVRSTYFFGQMHKEGFWYYFPVALTIKLTLGMLVLLALALFVPRVWKEHGKTIALLLIPAVGYLLIAMAAKMNIGVRHVLPVLPFFAIIAAAGAAILIRASQAWAIVVSVCLVAFLASSLRAAPYQISYANEVWGGSNHLYRYLGDSNLDWGQSSDLVNRYIAEGYFDRGCLLASGMPLRLPSLCDEVPTYYSALLWKNLPPVIPDNYTGTVIVNPLAVNWNESYLPFMQRKPDEVLGRGTILVYRGTFDLSSIAATRRIERAMFFLAAIHDPAHAMEELQAADAHCLPRDRKQWEKLMDFARNGMAQQVYFAGQGKKQVTQK